MAGPTTPPEHPSRRARLMLPALGALALAAGTAPALAAMMVGGNVRAARPRVVHLDLAAAVHADALGRLWGARHGGARR